MTRFPKPLAIEIDDKRKLIFVSHDNNGTLVPFFQADPIVGSFFEICDEIEAIVTAVNSYEANQALIKQLVEALDHTRNQIIHPDQLIDEALSAAKEAGF